MSHSTKNTDTDLMDRISREAKKLRINLSPDQEQKALTMLTQLTQPPSDYILGNIVRTVSAQ